MNVRRTLVAASAALVVFAPLYYVASARGDDANAKPKPILASVWQMPKEGSSLTVLASGLPDPAATTVNPDTQVAGMCLHCGIRIACKAGDTAGKCPVCPCGISAAKCIVPATAKPEGWGQMLAALPKGAGLRISWVDPAKPQSGLKSLAVDLMSALLPVDGLTAQDTDKVLPLVKPLGATKAELGANGKQLALTLKTPWTAEKEAKLETALGTVGAKLAYPAATAAK